MSNLSPTPKFLVNAMQGLSFWIGHRHALFRSYPLSEGALVAESCNLIQANLPSNLVLQCECMYKNLVPSSEQNDVYFGQSRADLVLCTSGARFIERGGNVSSFVRFVIEVKRASASNSEIDADLKRLHNFLDKSENSAHGYLIVVSENTRNPRFVGSDGTSKNLSNIVTNYNGICRVRRTVKAAPGFGSVEKANYVHLIEAIL